MKTILTFFLILITQRLFAQQEFSGTGILYNTFWIQTDLGNLTSFVIEKNEKEFLITALHGFKKGTSPSKVKIRINILKHWKNYNAILYHLPDTLIDIAILEISEKIQYTKPYELYNRVVIGQECRFYGFPYGGKFNSLIDTTRFIPFIKKALVSSIQKNTIYLDGINNPGFSGGPVVIYDPFDKTNKILGVISGYHPQNDSIVRKNNDLTETLKYQENSGIIYCYPLDSNIIKFIDSIE